MAHDSLKLGWRMNILSGISTSRIVVSVVALVAAVGAAQLAFNHLKPADNGGAPSMMVSKPEQAASPLAEAQRQASDLAAQLSPISPKPGVDDGSPAFDVVTI